MLRIKTWRDPYDAGFSTTRLKEIVFEEGLTVLVGCNGSGKTTLLMNIREQCEKENIPIIHYDNLKSGGSRASESAMYNGDFGLFGSLYNASEGEAVKINFGNVMAKTREFLKTGFYDTPGNRFFSALEDKKKVTDNRRVLLFDAIDSGLSIDSIIEVKKLFDLIIKDAKNLGVKVYIIVSANEYELARKVPSFDVAAGKYIELPDYEAYRAFIIKSSKRKERRNQAGEKALKRRKNKILEDQ